MEIPPPIQLTKLIEGIKTEFILSSFNDYLFFVVTQLGKFGTMIEARSDLALDGEPTFTINTLLGKREPALESYARCLIEITSKKSTKPLLLAIALKNKTTKEMFQSIIQTIQSNLQLEDNLVPVPIIQ